MVKITFIDHSGQKIELDVSPELSVMQAGTQNAVRGIVGECGGEMSCATCHCYVDEQFLDLLPPMSEIEDDMLDFTAADRKSNSRLGCQIKLTDALDGLVVTTPRTQT